MRKMGNSQVDRDNNYMKEVWGTSSLTSDYWSLPKRTENSEEKVLQEIMHDDLKKEQNNLAE
jgi:hypothetical protein